MATGGWIGDRESALDRPLEGRWIARPQRPRRVLQTGIVFALVLQIPNFLKDVLKPWLGPLGSAIACVAMTMILLAAVLLFGFGDRRARRMRAKDHALMDASFGDQYAVEVTIVANGKRLGTDRGVLWFADGLMGFSGSASSFVLAAWDVEAHATAKPKSAERPALPAGALELVGAPVPSYLTIVPLGKEEADFRERARCFTKSTADSDAERFWPPLVPYDEMPAWGECERKEALRP